MPIGTVTTYRLSPGDLRLRDYVAAQNSGILSYNDLNRIEDIQLPDTSAHFLTEDEDGVRMAIAFHKSHEDYWFCFSLGLSDADDEIIERIEAHMESAITEFDKAYDAKSITFFLEKSAPNIRVRDDRMKASNDAVSSAFIKSGFSDRRIAFEDMGGRVLLFIKPPITEASNDALQTIIEAYQ